MKYRQLIFNLAVAFSMMMLGMLVAKSDVAGLGLIAVGGGLSLLTMFSHRVEKRQFHHRLSSFNSEACQHKSAGETSCR